MYVLYLIIKSQNKVGEPKSSQTDEMPFRKLIRNKQATHRFVLSLSNN